jgi:[CysO sulfur-carrier protein]-S-L-cysteine hydrolase
MKNLANSPIAFSMDIEEISSAFDLIEKRNESLLGIYHSHPTDWAYPSPEDIALNNYPEVGHLIVSFARTKPEVKCFRMYENIVEQLFINLID